MKNIIQRLRNRIYDFKMRKKRYHAIEKYFRPGNMKPQIVYQKRFGLETKTILNNGNVAIITKDYPRSIKLSPLNEHAYRLAKELDHFLDGLELKENKNFVDVNKVVKKAKKLGYKYSEKFNNHNPRYFLNYEGEYYDIKLIDIAYSVINDGKTAEIYHNNDRLFNPIVMKNDIGMCLIMPYRYNENSNNIIIEI